MEVVPVEPVKAMNLALLAAEAGARELLKGYGQKFEVRHKGLIDLVTDFDLASEKRVKEIITGVYPDHCVVAEESGASGSKDGGHFWFIDPLDGTTNFTRSHPFFAVSVCYAERDRDGCIRPMAGVIYAPVLREVFRCFRGGGAWLSQDIVGRGLVESKLGVTDTNEEVQALANTGFPYDIFDRPEEILAPFGRMTRKVRAVRRAGAASLDLAYVAAGRAEAFWEVSLKPWDVAAGIILVEEAGGRVSDFRGNKYVLEESLDILASNRVLHEKFMDILKES